MSNIATAMVAGIVTGRPLWVAAGTYTHSTTLQLPAGLRMWGGYSADFTVRDPAVHTTLITVHAQEGMLCRNASDVLLDGIELMVHRPAGDASVYGVRLQSCSGVRLHNVRVLTSGGQGGTAGSDGGSGTAGGKV